MSRDTDYLNEDLGRPRTLADGFAEVFGRRPHDPAPGAAAPPVVVRVYDDARHEAVRDPAEVDSRERRGWRRVAAVVVGDREVVVMERP